MTNIGDTIERGEDMPADVLSFTDRDGDGAVRQPGGFWLRFWGGGQPPENQDAKSTGQIPDWAAYPLEVTALMSKPISDVYEVACPDQPAGVFHVSYAYEGATQYASFDGNRGL